MKFTKITKIEGFLLTILIGCIGILCFFIGQLKPVDPRSTQEILNSALYSTVSIYSHFDSVNNLDSLKKLIDNYYYKFESGVNPGTSGCTGIISNSQEVITNRHCVINSKTIVIVDYEGNFYDGRVLFKGKFFDLAKIHVPGLTKFPSMKFRVEPGLRIGEQVWAIGGPLYLKHILQPGIISDVNVQYTSGEFSGYGQISANIRKGMSGGPVVDVNGFCLGITTMMLNNWVDVGHFIPTHRVLKVMKEYSKYGKNRDVALGVYGHSALLSHGVVIDSMVDSSYFPAREFLAVGDTILAVDSVKVRGIKDLKLFLKDHYPGDTVEIFVAHSYVKMRNRYKVILPEYDLGFISIMAGSEINYVSRRESFF